MGFGAAAAREAMLSDAEAQRCNHCAYASTAYLDENPQVSQCSRVVESDICGAAPKIALASCKTLALQGWARGEREGYGEPCDVTSLSLLQASAWDCSEAVASQGDCGTRPERGG